MSGGLRRVLRIASDRVTIARLPFDGLQYLFNVARYIADAAVHRIAVDADLPHQILAHDFGGRFAIANIGHVTHANLNRFARTGVDACGDFHIHHILRTGTLIGGQTQFNVVVAVIRRAPTAGFVARNHTGQNRRHRAAVHAQIGSLLMIHHDIQRGFFLCNRGFQIHQSGNGFERGQNLGAVGLKAFQIRPLDVVNQAFVRACGAAFLSRDFGQANTGDFG